MKYISTTLVRAGLCAALSTALAATNANAQGSKTALFAGTPAEDAYTLYQALPQNPAGTWWKVGAVVNGKLDSRSLLDSAQRNEAQAQIAYWKDNAVTGQQLEFLGQIAVTAGNRAFAQKAFEERLQTRGLSISGRTYTLLVAVRAFSGVPQDTGCMSTALSYLARLDALRSAVIQRFRGHQAIANAYYFLGQGERVAYHLGQALALANDMSFEERYENTFLEPFLRWASVTSGLPGGRQRIDSMVERLRPLTNAPANLAMVPEYQRAGIVQSQGFDGLVRISALLGRPAPPITAQFWLNTTAPTTRSEAEPDAQIKNLNDGIIRVLEIGHYGCPGCLMALPAMERLRQSFPKGVEVWFVTDEADVWGMKRTTPVEQVGFLSDYYQKRNYHFPISIFIGARDVMDPDIGFVQRKNPTAIDVPGTPTFIITDGNGIIRHIGMGDDEEVLRSSVEYLIRESKSAAGRSKTKTLE